MNYLEEVILMKDTCKRITFMVTPEMEVMLDKTKKDIFL